MPADERSLSEGKTIAGKLLPTNVNDPVSIGGENTRTDKPGSDKSSDPMQVREFSDKFRVERKIGQGGMGEVYLAFDLKLNRPVAIKAILGQSVNSEAALQRFMTEAQAIAKIIHTHIVNIYELGQDKIGPYLVLEYVSGGSLADKLKSGPLSLERSIEIICQLCDGLAKVHAAGIIHRDIKPANILLTPEGDPKLTDFGLARHEYTDTGLTTNGAMIGTLGFMSPEQTNASQVDARSDIYSLGATLYQMVTGSSPRAIYLDDVPSSIKDILRKALKDNKDQRYQSAIEFRDALRGYRVGISGYDSNEGECPGCSTKNDPARKFCKKCANSLLALCLSCSESIRVWEEVCDHCGKKQSLFIAKLKEGMLATQLEAEDFLSNYDFDKALSLATQLKDQSDPRLRQFKPWAEEFVAKLDAERTKADEYLLSLMTKAFAHEQAYEYQSALDLLKHVHPNLSELVIAGYNESVNEKILRFEESIRYLNERRSRMRKVNIEVDTLIKGCRFDDAIKLLKPFADDSDERLGDLKRQSESFVARIDANRKQVYQQLASLINEAMAFEKVYDYEATLRVLDRIPQKVRVLKYEGFHDYSDWFLGSPVHRGSINEAYSRIKSLIKKIEKLNDSIQILVNQKDIGRTLEEINKILVLQPNRRDMIDLKSQLLDRYLRLTSARDESFDKAKKLFAEQNYEGCVNELNRIDLSVINEEIVTLLKRADRNNERVEALYSEIRQRIKTNQIDGLLLKVNELVTLKSDDKHILNLQEQLVERENAQESELVILLNNAYHLRDIQQFREAVILLCKIPKYKRKEAVIELLESCANLGNMQELAIRSIEECIVKLDYIEAMKGIAFAKENRLISKEKLKDLAQKCNHGLEVITKSEKISVLFVNILMIIITLFLLIGGLFALFVALLSMYDYRLMGWHDTFEGLFPGLIGFVGSIWLLIKLWWGILTNDEDFHESGTGLESLNENENIH